MTREQKRKMQMRIALVTVCMIGLIIFCLGVLCAASMLNRPQMAQNPAKSTALEPIAQLSHVYSINSDTQMAPEPLILKENWAEEEVPPRYGFTDEDVYLLAQLLCGSGEKDGDGEYDFDFKEEINYYEIAKVLCVVMNRVRHEQYYSDMLSEVVLDPGQFIVFPRNVGSVPSQKAIDIVKEWCDAYDRWDIGMQCIPEDHIFFSGNGITNETRARLYE